jgi:hypothetical protein
METMNRHGAALDSESVRDECIVGSRYLFHSVVRPIRFYHEDAGGNR